jgi:hypothetical protein
VPAAAVDDVVCVNGSKNGLAILRAGASIQGNLMLNFLAGSKVDHPMADAKKAREIIAELPADPLKALAEITQWLESLRDTKAFKVDRLFDNIDLLDGAAKNHQRKLAQDYFATSRQQKFQENRLWSSSFTFWKPILNVWRVTRVRRPAALHSGATCRSLLRVRCGR